MATMSKDELACVYSAAILADDDVAVTENKIKTLLKAANVEVENIWPTLFARALQGRNVRELITQAVMSGGAAPAAAAAGAQPGAADSGAATDAPAAADNKPVSDESDSDDMGFGLFD